MTHIIIFAYIVAIMLAVSALTVHWLSSKGDKKDKLKVSKPFIMGLLVINIYDFVIFYYVHIMTNGPANTLLSIGDCLIALLVVFWIRTCAHSDEEGPISKLNQFAQKYFVAYIVIWIVAKLLWPKMYLIRVLIDIPYLVVLIVAAIYAVTWKFTKEGAEGELDKQLRKHKVFVTACLFVNYGIYLFSEMGITLAIFNVIDFTIFLWLMISCANVFFIYKKDFKAIYAQRPPAEVSAEDAIRNIAIKKSLTAREAEILKEIYDGKSNTDIAQKLFISESTVKAHVYNLFRKLDTKSRLDAVRIIREERKQSIEE